MQTIILEHQGRVPVTVFKLEGNIDSNTSKQLQDQVREAFKAGMRYMLLDLSEVIYINNTGLYTMLTIYNLLSGKASQGLGQSSSSKSPYLKLLNPSPAVYEAVRIMSFDRVLEIHNNLDEAVASF